MQGVGEEEYLRDLGRAFFSDKDSRTGSDKGSQGEFEKEKVGRKESRERMGDAKVLELARLVNGVPSVSAKSERVNGFCARNPGLRRKEVERRVKEMTCFVCLVAQEVFVRQVDSIEEEHAARVHGTDSFVVQGQKAGLPLGTGEPGDPPRWSRCR